MEPLFHSVSISLAEHRLLHMGGEIQKPQPVLPDDPQAAVEHIKGKLQSPEAKNHLNAIARTEVATRVNRARTDETARQKQYLAALSKSAQAEFKHLTAEAAAGGGGLDPDKALVKLQEDFRAANLFMRLDGADLVVEGRQGDFDGRVDQVLQNEGQRKDIKDALGKAPQTVQNAALRMLEHTKDGDVQGKVDNLKAIFEKFSSAPLEVRFKLFTDGAAAIDAGSGDVNEARLSGLDAKTKGEMVTFLNGLDADQRMLVKALGEDFKEITKEQDEKMGKLTEDEKRKVVEHGRGVLGDFDASKAPEIEKNIMLARLQMAGIDVSNAEKIFAKPPELRAFDGTPMERSFHQLFGVIGYLLHSIDKMKKEKGAGGKGSEAPAGGKPERSPVSEERRTALKTEITARGGGNAQALLTAKQGELTTEQAKLLPADPDVTALNSLKGKAAPTPADKTEITRLEAKIDAVKKKVENLTADVEALNAMKTEAEDLHRKVLNSRAAIHQLLAAMAPPPSDRADFNTLDKIEINLSPSWTLVVSARGGISLADAGVSLNKLTVTRLGKTLTEMAPMLTVAGPAEKSTVDAFADTLKALGDSLRTEITNNRNRPPAAPAPAPAAPGGGT